MLPRLFYACREPHAYNARAMQQVEANPAPDRCEVLVIGAGPAGSACAHALACAGVDVLLVDQHRFPRDKVCGDGLIPDAHAALRRMGVYDEVAAHALPVQRVRCVAPRGAHIDVPGTVSVLPRRVLDHLLLRHAQRAGARVRMPARFIAPLLEGDRVVGARLQAGDQTLEVAARWVVLATGAAAPPLQAAGLCTRQAPSGVALRAYVRHEGLARQLRELHLVWHPRWRGGYAWLFPGPDGCFNLGAGITSASAADDGQRSTLGETNLRHLFEAFCQQYAPAAELMRDGEMLSPVKGAPLRCSLRGARWYRPGLLATGEAIGSTYAFTGEGIGKALETGQLAARALLQAGATPALRAAVSDAVVPKRYAATLQDLQTRFDLYETANHVNRRPWIADLVVWRAQRSPRLLRRLSGLLDETSNPGNLFTWRGIGKLLFE